MENTTLMKMEIKRISNNSFYPNKNNKGCLFVRTAFFKLYFYNIYFLDFEDRLKYQPLFLSLDSHLR